MKDAENNETRRRRFSRDSLYTRGGGIIILDLYTTHLAKAIAHGSDGITRSIDVVDQKTNMTESLTTFFIAIVMFEIIVRFRSMIMRQFQNGLKHGFAIANVLVGDVATRQKVEGEFGIVKVSFRQDFHPQSLVKLQRLFRVLVKNVWVKTMR